LKNLNAVFEVALMR